MRQSRLQPDVITYSSFISACAKGKETDKALEIFAEMKQSGLQPDVITFSELVSACFQGDRSEKALEIFAEIRHTELQPNAITCDALVRVRQKANTRGLAMNVFAEMQQETPGSEHQDGEAPPGFDRQMQQGKAPSGKKRGPNKIY